MSDTLITGGKLGGLLTFRTDVLDSTQNDLGRIALGISVAINEQHAQGYDLSGTLGGDFFTVGTPKVIGNENNSAAAGTPAATYVPGDLSKITNQDYRIQFDGTNYTITRVPEGTAVTPTAAGTTLSFDGLEIDTAGMTPAAGDSWLIQPTRNAAAAMTVAITDPDKVAAAGEASPGVGAGTANGDNALELAALRSKKVLANGSMGLNEGYSKLVNNVAVKTQANTTAQKAQESLISQNFSAQQAVSGVNLDEEYINLQQFQEQYRAAARLIDTASTLFDTLLALRS